MVVKMIRGSDAEPGSSGSFSGGEKDPSKMTLEEYDAWQAGKEKDNFQQLLNEVKAKNEETAKLRRAGREEEKKALDSPPETRADAPERELTMLEKLEQAKKRGAAAGVSKREVELARRKRIMEARKKAIENEHKELETAAKAKSQAEAPSEASPSRTPSVTPPSPTSSPSSLSTSKPEMPEWMKREKSQRADTVATAESSSADPSFAVHKKRTQNEALLDGLQALLDAKRDEERAYKARFNKGGSSIFGARNKREKNGRRQDNAKPAPVMLQKFRDDKAKIKAQMKEVRKAIVLEKKNSSKKS
eukprot:g551.t1